MATPPLLGRDAELARLDDLLVPGAAARGLIVRGPRGCGLSALIDAGDARARARGMRVLRANGVEAEAGFAYAGLHQLLRPLRRSLAALPDVQRDALGAALAGTDDPGARFAVGLAALGLLTAAAAHGPILVCVDDAHWLDRATLDAIAFVGRRLDAQPIALLAGAHAHAPLEELGLRELALGPLAAPDAAAMLDAVAPTLDPVRQGRVLHHAAGNPLALAELPLALAAADEGAALSAWAPLTPRLAATFGAGVDALDPDARLLLDAACLDDGGRVAHVVAVASAHAGRALTPAALGPAVDAGLAVTDGERVAFAHGLTRAAVRERLGETERRALHARWAALAAQLDDEDRAVWHRAANAIGADEALAADLAAVARRCARDGEHLRALTGAHAAARLTPAGPVRDDRLVTTAALAYEAGAMELGDQALSEVVAERLPPVAQARLAAMTDRRAVALALGNGERPRAAVWRPSQDDPWETALLGHAALLVGDPRAAAALLIPAAETLRAQGRLTSLARALALSAWAHALLGRLVEARRDAAEADRLCVALRQGLWQAIAGAALGLVAAWQGDDETAAERAAAAERVALPLGAAAVLALAQQVRATAATTAGRPADAHAHLLRLFDPLDPACAPGWAAGLIGDLAEAATTDAERAAAARLLARLPASRAPRLVVAAAHARLVLADDDADDPDAAYEQALVAADGWPLEAARARLVHGMRLRRMRRVADSRAPLREAADGFAALGATPWAERAIRELAATTETANRRGDDDGRLTPQELEIARMAARGMTNREIAGQLSLSPRTVGAHLAHVYPKLEIGARGALAAALAERGMALD